MSETPTTAEARKVVTVLFSDVTGSTVLGEALDPESLRQLMGRYFKEMKAVVQRHGGTTEKFIGDAIMAVFGIPRLHEDDALRAVRAAVEMREALHQLNDEFERAWGIRILARTGINTGEVIAGDSTRGESFVVGDAVNVAARLEQSAEPGTVLIGDATYRLVRDAAIVENIPPLSVKGKTDLLNAWRLVDVVPTAPGWARRLDSPLVGRTAELETLHAAFRRTVEDRTCEVVTIIGGAGVGKSRLSSEFLYQLEPRSRIVRGHCLPYGEGITFWPIVEVLREAAGISDVDSPDEARPKILELLEPVGEAPLIGERLAALLGLSDVTPGIQETFWAVRKLFEELAAGRPLAVVFDDIHWGEPTFLDLLEYLVDWIKGVPVLLLCLARNELLEVRGGWMTGKPNASLITLKPLTEPETDGLIVNLLGGGALAADAATRIAGVTEGNPLFIEEILRMLADDGVLQRANGSWAVKGDISSFSIPPTIQALITARLDRLEAEERAVIERASVMGRVFWWGAVADLSPEQERRAIGSGLQSLSRKDLIRPDRSELGQEDAFSFSHILIRDAAYNGIPKATRAELHERFAGWVQARTKDRAGEYEEIVGHHLEQAYKALSELSPPNERIRTLGRRASVPLASAGRRSFARGDMHAAVNLLSRALALIPAEDPIRPELLPDLAFALLEIGDFTPMKQVVDEATDAARASGDATMEARALVLRLWLSLFTNPEGWAEEASREATQAISLFEDQRDEPGLSRAWSLLGLVNALTCQFAASGEAWEKAATHAHAAGQGREELEYLSWIPIAVWGGPTPVEEGLLRCAEVLGRAAGDRKTMSTALFVMGKLEAMRGRFEEARNQITRARSTLEEISLPVWLAGPLIQMSGWVDILAGDPLAAERDLTWGVERLQAMGELAWMSTEAGILAEALYEQGRYEDIEARLRMVEEAAGSEDVYSQALLRGIRAKLLARGSQAVEAERLGREAVAIAEPTDFLFIKSFALLSLGEALVILRKDQPAREILARAAEACREKGFVVGLRKVEELLTRI
jgi:class 3 adenylate cyclase/tetratricopeptide (TPR) repeat protein